VSQQIMVDREGKSAAYFLPSRAHQEGRFAIVTNVGLRGAVDADALLTNGA
jgi:hypothetical protein